MKIRWLSVPAIAGLLMGVGQVSAETLSKDAFLDLAKKSGCLACHSIENKVVGPAWSTVSKELQKLSYDEALKRELDQIVNGGQGRWTEITGGVPMPPYGSRVAEADRKKLADFIINIAK